MNLADRSPGLAQHVAEVQTAARHGLPLLAIEGSLALIDICAALENDGTTNGARFKAWLDRNLPAYGNIAAEDLYRLRCTALHEGKARGKNYERIIFVPPNPQGLVMQHNTMHKTYQLSLVDFVDDICNAVASWRLNLAKDISALEEDLLRTRRGGMAPYIGGVDIIA